MDTSNEQRNHSLLLLVENVAKRKTSGYVSNKNIILLKILTSPYGEEWQHTNIKIFNGRDTQF